MKIRFALFSAMVACMMAVSAARADTVSVRVDGLQAGGIVTVYRGGTFYGHSYAAEFLLSVNGARQTGYCVDLDRIIWAGVNYTADFSPAPASAPWLGILSLMKNYDAADNFWGSAIQVAIWKLVYGVDNLVVTQPSVEAKARELVAEVADTRPLLADGEVVFDMDTWSEPDGRIHTLVTLTQDGSPVVGEWVMLSATAGTFVDMPEGLVQTDSQGQGYAALDLEGAAPPVTLTAEAVGQSLYILDPVGEVQILVQLGEPIVFVTSAVFDVEALNDPRSMGFWKHQIQSALSGKGRLHVDVATMESALPITVFDSTVSTLDELRDTLWPKHATMEDRARQQAVAVTLNVVACELGWWSRVDIDRDGAPDMWLWEAMDLADAAFHDDDPETAKTILDNINNQ